ncbi:MAG: hypothetical protein QXE90_01320, partial [Candidatus Micrarchaeia archaeon]
MKDKNENREELELMRKALEEKKEEKNEKIKEQRDEKKEEKKKEEEIEEKILEKYSFDAQGIPVEVKITESKKDYTPQYIIQIPLIAEGTKLILNALKAELITKVKIDIAMLTDQRQMKDIQAKFEVKANELLDRQFSGLTPEKRKVLSSYLIQHTLGLGELEILMSDENLEDIVINSPAEPIQVYHKRHGWCSTNLWIRRDDTVYEYASNIGRRVGRQINVLNP